MAISLRQLKLGSFEDNKQKLALEQNQQISDIKGRHLITNLCAKCQVQRSTDNQSIVFFLVKWIRLYLFNYMENFVHQKNDNNVLPAEIYFATF